MKVIITAQCHAEIMHYVNTSSIEVSGLGRIEKAKDGTLVVTSVYLIGQENGPSSTDLNPDAVAKLLYTSREDKGDLNFWWHSHVNMGVFWSGTDMDTIRQFGRNGYLLSTVFNKRGEHRTSYFHPKVEGSFAPMMQDDYFLDEIPTAFGYVPMQSQRDAWDEKFKALCTTKGWTTGNSFSFKDYYARGAGQGAFGLEYPGYDTNYGTEDYADDKPYKSPFNRQEIHCQPNDHVRNTILPLVLGMSGKTGHEIVRFIREFSKENRKKTWDQIKPMLTMEERAIVSDISHVMYSNYNRTGEYEKLTEQEIMYFVADICDTPETLIGDMFEELKEWQPLADETEPEPNPSQLQAKVDDIRRNMENHHAY